MVKPIIPFKDDFSMVYEKGCFRALISYRFCKERGMHRYNSLEKSDSKQGVLPFRAIIYRHWRGLLFFFMLCCSVGASVAVEAEEFLDVDQAYQLSVELGKDKVLRLDWSIVAGYSLYKERLHITSTPANALESIVLPEGYKKYDKGLQKEIEKYHESVSLKTKLKEEIKTPFDLEVMYQGCADAGLCYPPVKRHFKVDPSKSGAIKALGEGDGLPSFLKGGGTPPTSGGAEHSAQGANLASDVAKVALPAQAKSASAGGAIHKESSAGSANEGDLSIATRALHSKNTWHVAGVFFLFGVLLSLTPCVLPMVPILSSIIAGDSSPSPYRGLGLAAGYSLGMALVYTSLGVAAGLAGEGLAAALQNPWVLSVFAGLLCVLALSMFDVYQLQLPSGLQSYLSESTTRFKGGRFAGVFMMGAVSALIVGPCVAAPLAGALVYISQTKDVWLGGSALFSMAMGMSIPLLMTGLSMGAMLPRAGLWMVQVKQFFGLLLIGVALWMISSLLSASILLPLWGTFALVTSLFLGVFRSWPKESSMAYVFMRAVAMVLLLVGGAEWIGALSGGHDLLKPLSSVQRSVPASGMAANALAKLEFSSVQSVEALKHLSQSSNKPILVDFYADWCVACKEMERDTFSNPQVISRLDAFERVRVDVTHNTAEDKAMLKQFKLFGPPAVVMLNPGKEPSEKSRVVGYAGPEQFMNQLCQADQQVGAC
jgi:thioredoxin:protein disulfide reductase